MSFVYVQRATNGLCTGYKQPLSSDLGPASGAVGVGYDTVCGPPPVPTPNPTPTPTPTPTPSPKPPTCGISTGTYQGEIVIIASFRSLAECYALCVSLTNCRSYTLGGADQTCIGYTQPLGDMVANPLEPNDETYTGYDLACGPPSIVTLTPIVTPTPIPDPTPTPTPTPTPRPTGPTCNVVVGPYEGPTVVDTSFVSASQCYNFCADPTRGCKSFIIGGGLGRCIGYPMALADLTRLPEQGIDSYTGYDLVCGRPS